MKSGEARGNQTEITKTLRGINGSGMKVGLRTWEQSDFQNLSPAPLLGRLEVYFRRARLCLGTAGPAEDRGTETKTGKFYTERWDGQAFL